MKKLLLPLFLVFAMVGTALAEPIEDNVNYWPGFKSYNNSYFYDNGTYKKQNDIDSFGVPDITGGTVNYSHSTLTSISLNIVVNERTSSSLWSTITPGDWFIDLNADNVWDIVLDSTMSQKNGTWNAYLVHLAYGDYSNYEYSRITDTGRAADTPVETADKYERSHYGAWGGLGPVYNANATPRMDHPVTANPRLLANATKLGTVDFSGWLRSSTTIAAGTTFTPTWDLSSLGIDFDDLSAWGITERPTEIIVAFALSCANDVIYDRVDVPGVPTPEPGTFILAALGLFGLVVGYRFRKV